MGYKQALLKQAKLRPPLRAGDKLCFTENGKSTDPSVEWHILVTKVTDGRWYGKYNPKSCYYKNTQGVEWDWPMNVMNYSTFLIIRTKKLSEMMKELKEYNV